MPSPLDGLTAPQCAAVAHPGGALVVEGGPGTGKTHVVARRLAWLVEGGLPADGVLVLAASPAAAAVLRERAETALEPPPEDPWVSTFPGFCAWLLQHEAVEAGLDPFFAPVTRADRVSLLLERIDELTLRHHEIRGHPAPLAAGFVRRIDRLKEEMVEVADVRRHAERLAAGARDDPAGAHAAARELEFARVYEDHERLLAERGALDAGDLALHAVRLLRDRAAVRERLSRRLRHILVDDYQDATFAQTALLRELASLGPALAVTGDDRSYEISERSANGTTFTLRRDGGGVELRTCSNPGSGGCRASADAAGNLW